MTYKNIEASREARLWVTQVIMPTLVVASALVSVKPEIKDKAKAKFEEVKNTIKYKLHK